MQSLLITAGTAGLTRRLRKLAAYSLKRAERCYLAHAYVLSLAGAQQVLQKLAAGFPPDAALVCAQGSEARSGKRICFYLHPSLVRHSSQFSSDTCTQRNWKLALRTKFVGRPKHVKEPVEVSRESQVKSINQSTNIMGTTWRSLAVIRETWRWLLRCGAV